MFRVIGLHLPVLLLLLLGPATTAPASTCPALSPDDDVPDSCALQELLNRGGKIVLAAPADADSPGYILDRGLTLRVDRTSLTGPDSGPRARIVAHPELAETMLNANARAFTLAGLVFDGNRENRRHRVSTCLAARIDTSNLVLRGSGFVVHDIESVHTLCGSAIALEGRDFRIHDNWIVDNGWDIFEHVADGLQVWADGLTVWRCDHGQIYDNTLGDNTDIDIVVGGGPGCQVFNNEIFHAEKYGFGGIHVGWFPNGDGNHAGSIFENNRIMSRPNRLHFGLLVGFHPWDAEIWLEDGGRIADNYIEGAGINLAVDGVRKAEVVWNTLGPTAKDVNFQSCPVPEVPPISGALAPPFAVHTAHAPLDADSLQSGPTCLKLDEGKCEPCEAARPRPRPGTDAPSPPPPR